MKKKRRKYKKYPEYDIESEEQDEYFYFIAGYTPGGFPYGITWEEAYADGLVSDEDRNEQADKHQEELPF